MALTTYLRGQRLSEEEWALVTRKERQLWVRVRVWAAILGWAHFAVLVLAGTVYAVAGLLGLELASPLPF